LGAGTGCRGEWSTSARLGMARTTSRKMIKASREEWKRKRSRENSLL
jgi:hypothetical protein